MDRVHNYPCSSVDISCTFHTLISTIIWLFPPIRIWWQSYWLQASGKSWYSKRGNSQQQEQNCPCPHHYLFSYIHFPILDSTVLKRLFSYSERFSIAIRIFWNWRTKHFCVARSNYIFFNENYKLKESGCCRVVQSIPPIFYSLCIKTAWTSMGLRAGQHFWILALCEN